MKIHSLFLLIASISILTFTSCQNYTDDDHIPDPSAEFIELINNLKKHIPSQKFVIDPSMDNTINTDRGLSIYFPVSSFMTAEGLPVVSDSIYVEVKELYSIGDIILQHSSTMTDMYRLLETGGQVQIIAKDDSGNLLQAKNYNISFNADNTIGFLTKNMGLFRGNVDDTSTFIMWRDEPMVADTVKASMDTIGADLGFVYAFFDVDSLDWINLDRFVEEGIYDAKIKVDHPNINVANTMVYFIFDEIKSLSTLNSFNTETKTFSNLFYKFPAGYHVKFLVVSYIGDTIFYTLTDTISLDEDIEMTVLLEEITEEELVEVITSL